MCYNEKIQKLTLFDDDYMTVFFDKDIPTTELLLHIILNQDDLTVESVKAQEVLKNLRGHSLKLGYRVQGTEGHVRDFHHKK